MSLASVTTMPSKEPRIPEAVAALALAEQTQHQEKIGMARIEQHRDWPLLSRLPMRLTAGIPLRRFKVKDLLALRPGTLLLSEWLSSEDVPLKVGVMQLGFSEFEVVEQRMAVRLTRLA